MPLLTDKKRIAELRKQFPTLTHTSYKELSQIEPHPDVDMWEQDIGDVVFATSSSINRDFYVLRHDEAEDSVNFSFPYRDSNGSINRFFIFKKMKDTYYEHVVSSEKFTPIVSENGQFDGEWVSHDVIHPISVKKGSKEDILKRTKAKVFTIVDKKRFMEKIRDGYLDISLTSKSLNSRLEVVNKLADWGILKEENIKENITKNFSKPTKDGENTEDASNDLSVTQKALLQSKFTRR